VAITTIGSTLGRLAALGLMVIGLVPAAPAAYAGPAAQDATITVVVDRGEDATYYVGEALTVCISASRPGSARLVHGQGTAGSSVVFQGTLSERQCTSGPVTPPVGEESFRAELLDDQGQVVASQTVSYRTAHRGAAGTSAAPARPGQDVYAGMLDPCATVRQYVAQQGVTLLSLRGDPRAQQTIQQAWALLLPVLNDVAANPARVEELDALIGAQVERGLRGQGAYLNPDQGQRALQAIEGAAQRGVEAWSRGEQPDSGLLFLASLWSDGQRRAAWRAAALGGGTMAPGPNYPRCAIS
jgi:hypothetical protein